MRKPMSPEVAFANKKKGQRKASGRNKTTGNQHHQVIFMLLYKVYAVKRI